MRAISRREGGDTDMTTTTSTPTGRRSSGSRTTCTSSSRSRRSRPLSEKPRFEPLPCEDDAHRIEGGAREHGSTQGKSSGGGLSGGAIVSLGGIAVLVVFIVQNTQDVQLPLPLPGLHVAAVAVHDRGRALRRAGVVRARRDASSPTPQGTPRRPLTVEVQARRKRRQVAVMVARTLSSTSSSECTTISASSSRSGSAVSRTVGPRGVGRRKRTSKPAVMNGTGAPGGASPAALARPPTSRPRRRGSRAPSR